MLPHPQVPGLKATELTDAHEALLQRFYEANPGYSIDVFGQPPGPDEARETLHDTLPEGWCFTRQWVIGYLNEADELVAVASVVSDLLAAGVWHIGLFMVATALHGSGAARQLYQGIEAWAGQGGAQWLRLGVVVGNVRAQRFWAAMGFVESRRRDGVEMGLRVNSLQVMCKPLAGGALADYHALVPRDRPDGGAAA